MRYCITAFILALLIILNTGCQRTNHSAGTTENSELDSALAICHRFQSIPLDTFSKYSRLAVKLAQNEPDSLKATWANYWLCTYYFNSSNYDSCLLLCDKLQAGADHPGDSLHSKAMADITRGLVYLRKGQYQQALDWYKDIYPEIEGTGDATMLARLDNNMGIVNMEMTRYAEAIRWFHKLAGKKEPKLAPLAAVAIMNISICYANLNELDSAELYCMKGLELEKKNNNIIIRANSFNILGEIYLQKEQYDKAEEAILSSKEIRNSIGDPFYIISDLSQLSSLYATMGKYKEGIAAAEEALKLIQEHKIEGQYNFVTYALWDNYFKSGDYKKAAELGMQYVKYTDSVSNTASAKALAEWEVKYETAKKNEQIQKQHYQLQIKNYLIMGAIILLILAISLFYFIYKNRSNKHRALIHELDLQQQKALTEAIINAEESERNKISFNMHDGLGQYLSVIKMNLQSVKEKLPLDDRTLNTFNATQKMVEISITEMRSLSHQIMPNQVMRKGLSNALKDLIDKIDSNKLNITLDVEGLQSSINSDVQLVVYRILQECINNVIKHANANRLDIRIIQQDDRLIATVSDNGVGFATSRTDNEGIGLQSIQTRVKYLKGEFKIESKSNKGTTIHLDIPLQNKAA